MADGPRTADTSRYEPPTTSEWASGDSGATARDKPEDTAGDSRLGRDAEASPAGSQREEPEANSTTGDITGEDTDMGGNEMTGAGAEPRASAVATVTGETGPGTDVTPGGPDRDAPADADVASAVPAPRAGTLPEPAVTGDTAVTAHADGLPHGPHGEGSALPLEDGSSPHERFSVKGNADSGLYHGEDSPYHGRTRAEVWFETEDHARAAGYKPWNWRSSESQ